MLDYEIRMRCIERSKDLNEAEAFYKFIMKSRDFEEIKNKKIIPKDSHEYSSNFLKDIRKYREENANYF